jgi:hypothetical protein
MTSHPIVLIFGAGVMLIGQSHDWLASKNANPAAIIMRISKGLFWKIPAHSYRYAFWSGPGNIFCHRYC